MRDKVLSVSAKAHAFINRYLAVVGLLLCSAVAMAAGEGGSQFNVRGLVYGVVNGALTAFLIDLNAWKKGDGPFDWKLGPKRWLAGALTGATTALGWSATVQF